MLQAWLHLVAYLNKACSAGLYRIGLFAASRPKTTIALCLVVASVCSIGILQLEEETRVEKLWVPQGSNAVAHLRKQRAHFGRSPRVSALLFVAKDEQGGLLRAEVLSDLLEVHESVTALAGGGVSFEDVCYRNAPGALCVVDSVVRLWSANRTLLLADPSIAGTVLQSVNSSVAPDGLPFSADSVLGCATGEAIESDITTVPCPSATKLEFYVDGERESMATLWERAFLDYADSIDLKHVKLVGHISERSFDDELERSVSGDIPLVAIMIAIIVVFTSVALGWTAAPCRVLLGWCGVLNVILALIISFGVCSWASVPFSSLNLILPILIISVGVDDMFVLIHAVDSACRCVTRPIPEHIADAVARAGIPIAGTSLTSAVALALGANSSLPAVVAFATYAAVAVMADLVLQVTFFVACTSLIMGTTSCGKQRVERLERPRNRMRDFIRRHYSRRVLNPYTQAAVVVVLVILVALAVYGTTQLDQGITIPDDIVPDDSYLVDYFRANYRHFPWLGEPASIILEHHDDGFRGLHGPVLSPWGRETHEKLVQLVHQIEQSVWTTGPVVFWYSSFVQWLGAYHPDVLTVDGVPANSSQFVDLLQTQFLSSPPGVVFSDDVRIGTEGRITASRMRVLLRRQSNTLDERDAMLDFREFVRTSATPIDAFPFAQSYLFLEQYVVLVRDTLMNLALTAVALVFVTAFFIGHPGAVAWSALCVVLIIVMVLGLMSATATKLNAVSLVILMIGMGMAVDFTAHVVHSFVDVSGTRRERAVRAVEVTGTSVMRGAFSTLLGLSVLAFAQSSIFRVFFRLLFSVVKLSMMFAMFVSPVLLAIAGPDRVTGAGVPPCRAQRISGTQVNGDVPEQSLLEERVRRSDDEDGDQEAAVDADGTGTA